MQRDFFLTRTHHWLNDEISALPIPGEAVGAAHRVKFHAVGVLEAGPVHEVGVVLASHACLKDERRKLKLSFYFMFFVSFSRFTDLASGQTVPLAVLVGDPDVVRVEALTLHAAADGVLGVGKGEDEE